MTAWVLRSVGRGFLRVASIEEGIQGVRRSFRYSTLCSGVINCRRRVYEGSWVASNTPKPARSS